MNLFNKFKHIRAVALIIMVLSVSALFQNSALNMDHFESESRISLATNDFTEDLAIIKSDSWLIAHGIFLVLSIPLFSIVFKKILSLPLYSWSPEHKIKQPHSILNCGCHSPPAGLSLHFLNHLLG